MAKSPFLTGQALSERIDEVLNGNDVFCAVAFVGAGAGKRLSAGTGQRKLICNLSAGGTNPYEVEKLLEVDGLEIRRNGRLHAKVYTSSAGAVVSSANLSNNGLGSEEAHEAFWIEAGVASSQADEHRKWLRDLWPQSDEISETDIENAKARFKAQSRVIGYGDQLHKLPDEIIPIVSYFGTEEAFMNEPGSPGHGKSLDDLFDNWFDFYQWSEHEKFENGRWVLGFYKTKENAVSECRPNWQFVDACIRNGCADPNGEETVHLAYSSAPLKSMSFPMAIPDNCKHWRDAYAEIFGAFDAKHLQNERWFYTNERIKLSREFWKKVSERQDNG